MEIKVDVVLDAKGLAYSIPILKIKREIKTMWS